MPQTLSSLTEFWSHLEGPVHPEDARYFLERPDVAALLQKNFIPSAFFGDVENAKVILCYGNGGAEDEQAFYRSRQMQDALLSHIRKPGPIDPGRFFTYFRGEWHTQLIRDGQAALVNAVAYRSVNMNALTDANMKGIPSVRIARNWIKTACAEAAAGRRLVVFQRSRLWGVKGGDRDLSQLLILMDVSVLTVTPIMRVYTWASLCAKPETRYQRLPKAEICPGLGGQGRITHDSVIPRPC